MDMQETILWVIAALLPATASMAATVSGVVKNSYDLRLSYADITATEVGNSTNVVSADADHRGRFTMELGDGNWAVALDPEELEEWGNQLLSVTPVVSHGDRVIVHAGADDFTSQPTGAAGGRIGCGVIQLTQ